MNETTHRLQQHLASPESILLVCAVQAFLTENYADFGEYLASPVDWRKVEQLAEEHSVTQLLAYVLRQCDQKLVPEINARLREKLAATERRNMIWLATWQHILRAFDAAGIRAISLKGPAFALQAYGNLSLREFTDLDFLISPQDMEAACNLLQQEGYRLRSPDYSNRNLLRSANCQLEFLHKTSSTAVDLHWAVTHKMFSFQLHTKQLLESAVNVDLDGSSFLALSPENQLLYLCAHGSKHGWAQLRLLGDLACHLKAAKDLNWEKCIRSAEEGRGGLVVRHSLLLAQQVLRIKLPAAAEDYVYDAISQSLVNRATAILFHENASAGDTALFSYHVALETGWHDRMRFLVFRLFVPTETDWEKVRLPRWLSLLYYILRPMRLLFGSVLKSRRIKE